jgi:hypothetical protein
MTTRILMVSVALVAGLQSHLVAEPAEPKAPGVRGLDELLNEQQPGIDLVRRMIKGAKNHVVELKGERAAGERALLALQVTSAGCAGCRGRRWSPSAPACPTATCACWRCGRHTRSG